MHAPAPVRCDPGFTIWPPVLAAWVLAFLLALPSQAWAVQAHGQSEGWLVHQLAHILFMIALIFLLTVLHRRPPGVGRPWKMLKLSLFLFLLWNIDTITVHWLASRLPEGAVDQCAELADRHIHLPASSLWLFYYMGSLDHLLCVPAIVFLFLSLRGFAAETGQPRMEDGKG
ncbi:MAG: hypothetical protein ACOY3Z_08085 [Thermodesulfobacteriota bacterium]